VVVEHDLDAGMAFVGRGILTTQRMELAVTYTRLPACIA
jgi:hypothetical protein